MLPKQNKTFTLHTAETSTLQEFLITQNVFDILNPTLPTHFTRGKNNIQLQTNPQTIPLQHTSYQQVLKLLCILLYNCAVIIYMCVYLLSGDLLSVEELKAHTTYSTKLSAMSD
jgi:hypothetical protein